MADLDLIVVDDLEVHKQLVDGLESGLNETLYPGDERKIFAEVQTSVLTAFFVALNEKFNQRFAKYAKGKILDAHGENEGCERLSATASTDVERFILSAPLSFNVVIPRGTRVTADNEKYFATDNVAVIYAGSTSVDVGITAQEGGSNYNGYSAGKLNRLVDKIEYIASVTNLNGTSGGDDGEPYPEVDDGVGDEHYYERIRISKASKSTAGAEDTYIFYAKTADARITDVYPTSPNPGQVKLYIALKDGEEPDAALLKKVVEICSAKDVRPLGDLVSAAAIEQIPYDIELTYYTTAKEEASVVEEVEGEGGAIERFIKWQSESSKDINQDRLRSEILKSDIKPIGAERVEIVKPVFTEIERHQIAKFSGRMTIRHVAE